MHRYGGVEGTPLKKFSGNPAVSGAPCARTELPLFPERKRERRRVSFGKVVKDWNQFFLALTIFTVLGQF